MVEAVTEIRPGTPHQLRVLTVVTLTFLPWIVVVLLTAGIWAAVNILGYSILVFAAGYSIVSASLPASSRNQAIVLAPAAGILAISALTAFWVRLGISVFWAPVLWLALACVGAACLWCDRQQWNKTTMAYGKSLAALSLLICAVFFLPGARNDAVLRQDGSFNWIYVDTQYNYAIATAIKIGSPPREPGTVTEELFYHFGPYAPAAAISRLDGLDMGDAYARVTRGASLWALVLSSFGLGTLLSLKATGEKFGGIMSVTGLFFYGALLSLFTDESNSSSHVRGAILFTIPKVDVRSDGGPFSHLILGHSTLHALAAITAIFGLCLLQRESGVVSKWREFVLLALPAFAVTVHSVGALYCLGAVAILLYWGRLKSVTSWLSILLMGCLFLGAWKIMAYGQAADAEAAAIRFGSLWDWWTIVIWFVVGLGFRIVGFRWISKPFRDPLSALVLATTVGFLMFFLLVQFTHEEQVYGMIYLQCMLSIFAFSRLSPGCWRGAERSQWAEEWIKLAKWGLILLVACAVLLRIIVHAMHSQAWVGSISAQILPCCLFILLLFGTAALMKRSRRFSTIASAALMGVLLIGFTAWIAPWLNFGLRRMKMDVTVAPGDVRSLKHLGELMVPGERFATNKHGVDSLATNTERSHAYAALSEHLVLLEGLFYHVQTSSQNFQELLRENDLMFSTTDPDTLHMLSRKWNVKWLVARPGTDIALPRPLPSWLTEQADNGSLKIYKIDP